MNSQRRKMVGDGWKKPIYPAQGGEEGGRVNEKQKEVKGGETEKGQNKSYGRELFFCCKNLKKKKKSELTPGKRREKGDEARERDL